MNKVVEWLKANADEYHNKDGIYYIIEGNNGDETRFDIGDKYIKAYWANEYGDELRDLTPEEFTKEYIK